MRTFTEQEEQGRRLREVRAAKFPTATDGWEHAKRFAKLSKQTYIQHENGTRGFKAHAAAYARAFDTTASYLLWGTRAQAAPIQLPVTGKVAAGIDGHYDSDYAEGDGIDSIIIDADEISLVCEVAGDSMAPRYRDKDKVAFGHGREDLSAYVRRDVMAQTKDGRKLFKVLRKGSRPGFWDLYSINPDYDPIRDVELDFVLPVKMIVI